MGVKPFSCKICGTSFTLKGALVRHCNNVHELIEDKAALMKEIEEQDVKPAIFDVEAVYVDDAGEMDVKEEPQEEELSCDICYNSFPDYETLSEHKLSHDSKSLIKIQENDLDNKEIKSEQLTEKIPLKIKIKIPKKSKSTVKLKNSDDSFENEALIDKTNDE